MQRIVKLSFAGMFLVAVMAAFPLNLLAQGAERTDHMHLPATDGVGYCGVGRHAEPWTLHIAASAGAEAAAVLKVAFRDADSITFNIPANTSFSFTEAMGGVPEVDDLVRITLTGAGADSWVSARARPNTTDPFIEPGAPESDNLCVGLVDEGPISTLLAVPDSWVEDDFGANGGTLE